MGSFRRVLYGPFKFSRRSARRGEIKGGMSRKLLFYNVNDNRCSFGSLRLVYAKPNNNPTPPPSRHPRHRSLARSQIILLVVPVQTGVAGALYLGATLYQVVTNGAAVPFLGGPTQEIWRTLGAVAAGVAVAVASRGRGGGRYKFIQRH